MKSRVEKYVPSKKSWGDKCSGCSEEAFATVRKIHWTTNDENS
jgi:hypothetical protein